MGWIRLVIEDREMPPPTSVNWQSPNLLGIAFTGEPVVGTGWRCTISYGLTIEPHLVEQFVELIGKRVKMLIQPSPMVLCDDNQVYGSIAGVGVRYSQDAISGIDIEVVHIVPEVTG